MKVAISPPGVRTLFRSIHYWSSGKSNMSTGDSISSFYLHAFCHISFSSDLWPPTEPPWIIHSHNPTAQHQCPRNLFGSFIGRRWRAIKHRTLDPRRSGSQKVDPMIPQGGLGIFGVIDCSWKNQWLHIHGSNHCKDCQSLCFHMVWNIFVPLKTWSLLFGRAPTCRTKSFNNSDTVAMLLMAHDFFEILNPTHESQETLPILWRHLVQGLVEISNIISFHWKYSLKRPVGSLDLGDTYDMEAGCIHTMQSFDFDCRVTQLTLGSSWSRKCHHPNFLKQSTFHKPSISPP